MTRLFLAAGVAALAIATPAAAGPHGGGGPPHGGGGGNGGGNPHGGGGGGNPHGGGGGGGGFHGGGAAFGGNRGGGGQQARPQQMQRMEMHAQRQQARPQQFRVPQAQHAQARSQHQQGHGQQQQARRMEMRAQHQQMQAQRGQMRGQQMRAQHQQAERQQMRNDHAQQAQNQRMMQQQVRNDRAMQQQQAQLNRQNQALAAQQARMAQNIQGQNAQGQNGQGYGVGGCPPGLANKGCMPPGLARQDQMQALRSADAQAFQNSNIQMLTPQTRILAPTEAMRYLGAPLSMANNAIPLAALPQSVSYLYPNTPDSYYRYGDGYVYQVDRSSNLISSLLPLLGGGYLPGSYLPQNYMSSYVPDYYGLNSFYPANYSNYGGYGDYYGNTCNRYANGVVYQVDCASGMVENIVPTYAGGYGVGQMLPSSYGYYNVPTQYRSMYYPTADSSYWYAPGAIYQTDPSSNLITSVAALLSPGFSVGQQLPMGYNMYNVPMAYRSTYYDTPNAWYRYNNGNIYQVDPTTQLVTAIVASLLT